MLTGLMDGCVADDDWASLDLNPCQISPHWLDFDGVPSMFSPKIHLVLAEYWASAGQHRNSVESASNVQCEVAL